MDSDQNKQGSSKNKKQKKKGKKTKKGKGPNLRNYGNLNTPDNELNVEEQAKGLKAFKNKKKEDKAKAGERAKEIDQKKSHTSTDTGNHKSRKEANTRRASTPLLRDLANNILEFFEKKKPEDKSKKGHKEVSRDHTLRPIHQIDPKSYLGKAFSALNDDIKPVGSPANDSSSSELDTSEDDDSNSDVSSESSDNKDSDSSHGYGGSGGSSGPSSGETSDSSDPSSSDSDSSDSDRDPSDSSISLSDGSRG
ncbi:hypothetical protein NP233_g2798 [Leucocoprinus birnbaumii]|uniref:Uncharacterized protein n=1 Tax=Leucocoprinus birnbaumii TaxID=56174 RepID=A0AAD5YTC9_9AGAR|nr:hypothetical protein NP233_g2798 [Leucocoprinus birnbaumii]